MRPKLAPNRSILLATVGGSFSLEARWPTTWWAPPWRTIAGAACSKISWIASGLWQLQLRGRRLGDPSARRFGGSSPTRLACGTEWRMAPRARNSRRQRRGNSRACAEQKNTAPQVLPPPKNGAGVVRLGEQASVTEPPGLLIGIPAALGLHGVGGRRQETTPQCSRDLCLCMLCLGS